MTNQNDLDILDNSGSILLTEKKKNDAILNATKDTILVKCVAQVILENTIDCKWILWEIWSWVISHVPIFHITQPWSVLMVY